VGVTWRERVTGGEGTKILGAMFGTHHLLNIMRSKEHVRKSCSNVGVGGKSRDVENWVLRKVSNSFLSEGISCLSFNY